MPPIHRSLPPEEAGANLVFEPTPLILEGAHVRLEPLEADHASGLWDVRGGPGHAPYAYLPDAPVTSLAEMRAWVDQALAEVAAGRHIAWALRDQASGRVAGSTRYLDLRLDDRALEIGATWLGPAYRRTALNTEAKLLLLGHAFEGLGAVRVCLKTDARNLTSQRAIERLGAVREGTLRQHMILWDGHVRDTVYYSILDSEWPTVQQHLRDRLAQG